MQYLGGKSRQARRFAHIIDAALLRNSGVLIEPFVGGFNIVPRLNNVRRAICSDIHPGVISLYRAMQSGWIPPTRVTEADYIAAKTIPGLGLDPRTAFISFACSFGGKEWGGYSRNSRGGNYARGGASSLRRKFPTKALCEFHARPYDEYIHPEPAVYYCDPPYQGTLGYGTGSFDSPLFFRWCEVMSDLGNEVYVSEYSAPENWECLHTETMVATFRDSKTKTRTTHLFRVASG